MPSCPACYDAGYARSSRSRPPGIDAEVYKQWRGLATRCDKPATAYQAALHLAAVLIWTRR
ncbi:hypothetical protein ACFVX6_12865 [Streptomyces sp. NPDC058289]|uniref:hypothetical protein n=1 Tax=Streptomyces sp. NPDC058289 TaxID=3346425 RepID=UPI0036EEE2F9